MMFVQPDPRFAVWAARLQMPSGPVYVFSAAGCAFQWASGFFSWLVENQNA